MFKYKKYPREKWKKVAKSVQKRPKIKGQIIKSVQSAKRPKLGNKVKCSNYGRQKLKRGTIKYHKGSGSHCKHK